MATFGTIPYLRRQLVTVALCVTVLFLFASSTFSAKCDYRECCWYSEQELDDCAGFYDGCGYKEDAVLEKPKECSVCPPGTCENEGSCVCVEAYAFLFTDPKKRCLTTHGEFWPDSAGKPTARDDQCYRSFKDREVRGHENLTPPTGQEPPSTSPTPSPSTPPPKMPSPEEPPSSTVEPTPSSSPIPTSTGSGGDSPRLEIILPAVIGAFATIVAAIIAALIHNRRRAGQSSADE